MKIKLFKKMTQNNKCNHDYVLCHSALLKVFKNGASKVKAFTLVETLVAISVLMISVTGPLYYASESLKAATYAKEQITAFYLAQDAFEQIIKIRDDNVYSSSNPKPDWYRGLTGCEINLCRVNPGGTFLQIDAGGTEESYRLYLGANNAYSHNINDTKTIYLRKVKIEATDGGSEPNFDNSTTEMKVTVRIEWTSRGTQRSFEAYEFLRALNS